MLWPLSRAHHTSVCARHVTYGRSMSSTPGLADYSDSYPRDIRTTLLAYSRHPYPKRYTCRNPPNPNPNLTDDDTLGRNAATPWRERHNSPEHRSAMAEEDLKRAEDFCWKVGCTTTDEAGPASVTALLTAPWKWPGRAKPQLTRPLVSYCRLQPVTAPAHGVTADRRAASVCRLLECATLGG